MTKEQGKVFISEADQYLFSQATHYDIYKKLGAHVSEEGGEKGVYFGVWAPNAEAVHVIGSFNDWNGGYVCYAKNHGNTAIRKL